MMHFLLKSVPAILLAACAVGLAAADPEVPHVSPRGAWTGPLEIPHIARFRLLPQRVLLEPQLFEPSGTITLLPDVIPFLTRVLRESEDPEVLQHAAESLARIQREGEGDITEALPALRTRLDSSALESVRHACAMALIAARDRESAGALLSLLEHAAEPTRLLVEPVLAEWKLLDAASLWNARIAESRTTTVSFRLAATGLAELGESSIIPALADMAGDVSQPFGKRAAAAEVVARMEAARARTVAEGLIIAGLQDRLVAVRLLSAPNPDSIRQLTSLCKDASDAVAAAAWQSVFALDPASLLPLLETGRTHNDAVVRMTAARTMGQHATPERVGWLDALISDIHLEVRNVARAMLLHVAQNHSEFHDQIVAQAGDKLKHDPDDWQGIEQSLLLLGQLRQTVFSPDCVPLLQHTRAEVYVTSAWLMHLYPDDTVATDVEAIVRDREARLLLSENESGLNRSDLGEQLGLLYQLFGLWRNPAIDDILDIQFSKSTPGGAVKRAAGMWALGLIHENTPDSPLVKKFEGRVLDNKGIDPERIEVRRLSAISLARLRSVNSTAMLMEKFHEEGISTLIPQAIQWGMQVLGQPVPELAKPHNSFVGGFLLNPAVRELPK